MREVKPATDAEIENWRGFITQQSTIRERVIAQTIEPLIARIDTERARVKVLEETLRAFIAAHEFAGAESWDCTGETRQRFEHAASAAKLLFEETANG